LKPMEQVTLATGTEEINIWKHLPLKSPIDHLHGCAWIYLKFSRLVTIAKEETFKKLYTVHFYDVVTSSLQSFKIRISAL